MLAFVCVDAARADVTIEGNEAALRITADNTPVNEVLAALKPKIRLRYDGATNVSRNVSGTIPGRSTAWSYSSSAAMTS